MLDPRRDSEVHVDAYRGVRYCFEVQYTVAGFQITLGELQYLRDNAKSSSESCDIRHLKEIYSLRLQHVD